MLISLRSSTGQFYWGLAVDVTTACNFMDLQVFKLRLTLLQWLLCCINIKLHVKNELCLHKFVAERHHTVTISFECHFFFAKTGRHLNEIATVWVPFCNKYMWTNMFLMCDCIFNQHNSHSDKVKSLNLKTSKFINLQTIRICMDGL